MNKKRHILSLIATVVAFCLALPVFAQDVKVCIGSRVMYAANGFINSTFEYSLEPEAGIIIQTHNDSIIVEWGNVKGIYQLGVREISAAGCVGDWAYLNVEVVGEYAQFTQAVYNLCGTGGVLVDFNKNDFIAYSWADPSVSQDGYITTPGIYELITIDQNYCRLSSFIEVVQSPINISLGADTMICTPGFTLYALNTQDNPAETVYTWSTGESGEYLTQITVDDHDMDENAIYWVRAEYDGCVVTDTITVLACIIPEEYRIPNTFTPNDDGENDVWNIYMLLDYPDCIVEVFDRWGRKVFNSTRGYTVPWDGRDASGRYLPVETYYYIIHLNDNRTQEPVIGTITIIR